MTDLNELFSVNAQGKQATNAVTTVTVEFRTEVATSAVTAQIGTAAAGIIF